jgi:hypothetical protein
LAPGALVNEMRGDVLRRGADAARPKLGEGPVEKDTERLDDSGGLEGRYDAKGRSDGGGGEGGGEGGLERHVKSSVNSENPSALKDVTSSVASASSSA